MQNILVVEKRRTEKKRPKKSLTHYLILHLVATKVFWAEAGKGSLSSNNPHAAKYSIPIGAHGSSGHAIPLRGGSSMGDDQVGFFGDFQDELRKMREEMEVETQQSLENLHELHLQQQEKQKSRGSEQKSVNLDDVSDPVEPANQTPASQSSTAKSAENEEPQSKSNLEEIEATESMEDDESEYDEDVKVILKPVNLKKPPRKKTRTVTKSTEQMPVTLFSGGANTKSRGGKSEFRSEEDKQLREMRKMLQVEFANVEKNLRKNELRRAGVTGLLLILLCILTSLALRVVEKSLGVS